MFVCSKLTVGSGSVLVLVFRFVSAVKLKLESGVAFSVFRVGADSCGLKTGFVNVGAGVMCFFSRL